MTTTAPDPVLELVLASPARCLECGGGFVHLRRSRPNSTVWRQGRVPHRCPACDSPAARRRRARNVQRAKQAKEKGNFGMACGCGRDYLQVPLGEAHLCPFPRPAKPTAIPRSERHADYQARYQRERTAASG